MFETTMAEFCQMLRDQSEAGNIYGFNLPNGGIEQVAEDIENLRYYKDERPIVEPWAAKGDCFQIDEKYVIVLTEDGAIDTVLGMYEIKKWVKLGDIIGVSGTDNLLVYDRSKRSSVFV